MKKLFLLALLPLFVACKFNFNTPKLSPTITGVAYAVESATLGDADAESDITAIIIGGKDWDGKAGETRDLQVQVLHNAYGGKPDMLSLYYFLDGTISFLSGSSCSIKMKDNFPYINGTYTFTRSTEDGTRYVMLKGSGKQVKLRFWHETD